MMICAECGAEMRVTSGPLTETFRGQEITIEGIERYQCDRCGDTVMTTEAAERHAAAMVREYARTNGMLSPEEIRELRKSLGLTQQQFESMLGVSSPTVSRWETGVMLQSKTADKLMRIVRDSEDGRRLLMDIEGLLNNGPASTNKVAGSNQSSGDMLSFAPKNEVLHHDLREG